MLSANLPFHRFGMVAAKDYFFGGKKKRKLLSRLMNLLPIDRQPKRKQIEEHLLLCEQFCRKSQGVLIFFPEGTRSRSGRMQPFKKGAVQYAAQLNIPIIPVHIDGTFRSFPKGKKLIRPGKIEVHIGKPMHVKDSGLAGLRTATAELEEAVLALKERPNE
jgi:1-acyl-sn-glycerol-3-phosphate acyltransferase